MTIESPTTVQNASTAQHTLDGVARLTHLGVLKASGDDAAKFLHGQLTNDFVLLGANEARLCGYCSAKGRLLASFIGFKRTDQSILLIGSSDLIATIQKRLSMFVLRAQVKLEDASPQYAVFGLAGSALDSQLDPLSKPWAKIDAELNSTIALYPSGEQTRQLRIQRVEAAAPQGEAMPLQTWMWGEVLSAVPTVTKATAELFVPQMLNFESIGAINFKKGCYPGQEVVARSQFRGTIKRRTFLMQCDALPEAGAEVFDASEEPQSVGHVVQSAIAPSGAYVALVSAQVTSVQEGPLHLGEASGPLLTTLPLPYSLLEDV